MSQVVKGLPEEKIRVDDSPVKSQIVKAHPGEQMRKCQLQAYEHPDRLIDHSQSLSGEQNAMLRLRPRYIPKQDLTLHQVQTLHHTSNSYITYPKAISFISSFPAIRYSIPPKKENDHNKKSSKARTADAEQSLEERAGLEPLTPERLQAGR
ncbi:hypothetical protein CLAFUW4_03803 [Fulvia fulva]|uniref:Uncharacterized protein n=1 Tax=Passalora fulva TaxID=5499 RepID=A0A9Q8LB79_PASFU|nr:uncharacterized protein CLAFUR5_03775 [Fulvia fulva]KAK4631429.1 hypothetical protein CLAFUR4_03791 [Fulvia fulva]KAK4633594.1 hypothetical protein CLAFUR0_03790 [Fulvia fulva]UJO14194.1 hypothetical protein CLAFUR5_03775 [Fulvia fulva]WPV10809.1 hypothetical protein CLAFUW4_03803 [Fulvia fulva]WPV26496.1 hypothetical protein CLAFUW7_03795 [Fulvia fulva]